MRWLSKLLRNSIKGRTYSLIQSLMPIPSLSSPFLSKCRFPNLLQHKCQHPQSPIRPFQTRVSLSLFKAPATFFAHAANSATAHPPVHRDLVPCCFARIVVMMTTGMRCVMVGFAISASLMVQDLKYNVPVQ